MECVLENLKIYYEIYGEGKPVLMLHGFMPDHRLMKGCVEPIFEHRDNYKRIYFDLPGMGKTPGPKWLISTDQMLDVVLEFIDKVIPNEKFIIASESYGSYLARGIILKKSNFIEGVLFICPLIIPQPEERDLPQEFSVIMKDNELISSLNPLEVEELEESLVIQKREVWERYRDEIWSGLKIADQTFLYRIFPTNYSFSFEVDQLLELYNKPTLFLLGRQDTTVGYRDAWKIIENYPRATFAILDQAGHNLNIEKENLFNSLVNEWLDRVEYQISIKD
ncbi:MAG: 2-hydroxy-6-oxo-6-phenylhexa-2,4-dienoate hydrolase [Promethearchaeota archaeon Loki_b32]|nr:MAG: 2-hydroxy-6-oxo-6-phenylhexa-2,4-dienoate hydrolase [Candidatus Lokiarchaeota archaeon Loki_b32]